MASLTDIKGIGPSKAGTLEDNGYESLEDIAQADPDNLSEISGISDERALEYMIGAGDLLDGDDDSEDDEEASGEEFDLTPSEVSDELEGEESEETTEESSDSETADESSDDESSIEETEELDPTYEVSLQFDTQLQYDVYHAALMRHHEQVYTSYQPASDAMQKLLDGLDSFDSVTYELTEYELNTLHTGVKQCRSDYQGNNKIDHMDALNKVEDQIDDARAEYLL